LQELLASTPVSFFERGETAHFDELISVYLARHVPSGLKWQSAGVSRPVTGRELINPRLEKALSRKTELTQDEWDAVGIQDLAADHFIKSGGSYFMPDDERLTNRSHVRLVLVEHYTCSWAEMSAAERERKLALEQIGRKWEVTKRQVLAKIAYEFH